MTYRERVHHGPGKATRGSARSVSRFLAVATHTILIVLAVAGCDATTTTNRTISPVEAPFDEMFQLVEVLTPEQTPESPIALISGASWDGARIAVADASEGNAKLFDGDGSLIATMGRSGEGPGEFRSARFPQLLDGRLYMADGQLGRVTVWTGGGELEREIDFRFGFVSDFAVLPDGRMVFAGLGVADSAAAMGVYADDGAPLRHGLYTIDVLPAGADPSLPWGNLRQNLFAVSNDTAWAVSTISDSIWAVPLNSDVLQPEAHRLAIPGYVPPAAPENPLRSIEDLMAWGKSFHGAARPVASSELLAVPFVQGVLNYGDPTILVLRDENGDWYALSDPPPVIAAHANQLLVIHNPLGDPVELAVYEARPTDQGNE